MFILYPPKGLESFGVSTKNSIIMLYLCFRYLISTLTIDACIWQFACCRFKLLSYATTFYLSFEATISHRKMVLLFNRNKLFGGRTQSDYTETTIPSYSFMLFYGRGYCVSSQKFKIIESVRKTCHIIISKPFFIFFKGL